MGTAGASTTGSTAKSTISIAPADWESDAMAELRIAAALNPAEESSDERDQGVF